MGLVLECGREKVKGGYYICRDGFEREVNSLWGRVCGLVGAGDLTMLVRRVSLRSQTNLQPLPQFSNVSCCG